MTTAIGCGRVAFAPMAGDAPAPDPSDSAGAASCLPGAILCDDFETGTFGQWDGFNITPGGTVVIDGQAAHGGALALDATIPMLGNGAAATACKQYPAPTTGILAFRAWIYTPTQLDQFQSVLSLVNLPGCAMPSPQQYVNVGCDDLRRWTVTEADGAGGLLDHRGTTCAPPQTWTCIELDVTFDVPRRFELFVNDALVVSVAPADAGPTYQLALLGVARATAAGYRAFADDAVIARSHIGCGQP